MKYIETVDCIVKTSWDTDAIQPITSLPSLDTFISSFALFKTETLLLEKLLYKNGSQHRRAPYFKNLQEVRRLSRLLHQLDMQYLLEEFITALHQTQIRNNKQWQTNTIKPASLHHRKLPTHQSATFVLHRLTAGIHLIEALGKAIIKATQSLSSQLAMSFFMPMCLTALACIARLRTLSAQIAVQFIALYNSVAEVSAVLPPISPQYIDNSSSEVGRRYYYCNDDGELPQMVKMTWKTGGVVKLKPIKVMMPEEEKEDGDDEDGDEDGRSRSLGLLRRAEDTMARCIRVVGTKSVEKRVRSTTLLNVVEDVGVAIQREEDIEEIEEVDEGVEVDDDGNVMYKRAKHTLDGSTLPVVEDMEENAMEVDVDIGVGESVGVGRDDKKEMYKGEEEEKRADLKPAFISIDMLGKKKKTKRQKKAKIEKPGEEEKRIAGWEDWV